MSLIEVKTSGAGVVDVIFNRPEKLNAFSPQLIEELFRTLSDIEADKGVSCIVLSGSGRAFSVGYDVNASIERRASAEKPQSPLDDWRHMVLNDERTWLRFRETLIPVVAAIHGYCLGAAAMVATCSDVVVAADDVQIGWASFRGGGGWLGPAMSFHLGNRKARELEFRYGRFSGAEAFTWGWANYAVPPETVLAKAHEIAADIARTPRELLEIKKRSMNMAQDSVSFSSTVAAGALWDAIGHYSDSGRESSRLLKEVGLKEAIVRNQSGNPIGDAGSS